MERRVPESFFDERLRERVRVLLARVSPPTTDVVLCHLDAPGWSVADLGASPSAPSDPTRLPREPLLAPAPKAFADTELSLRGVAQDEKIFWEWEPAPRCSVFGWFPDEQGWDLLRGLLSTVARPLREALTYPGFRA